MNPRLFWGAVVPIVVVVFAAIFGPAGVSGARWKVAALWVGLAAGLLAAGHGLLMMAAPSTASRDFEPLLSSTFWVPFLGFPFSLLCAVCLVSVVRRGAPRQNAVYGLGWKVLDGDHDVYSGWRGEVEVEARIRRNPLAEPPRELILSSKCLCSVTLHASASALTPAALRHDAVPLTRKWPAGWSASGAPRWDASALASVLAAPGGGTDWRSLALEDRRLTLRVSPPLGITDVSIEASLRDFKVVRDAIESWSGERPA